MILKMKFKLKKLLVISKNTNYFINTYRSEIYNISIFKSNNNHKFNLRIINSMKKKITKIMSQYLISGVFRQPTIVKKSIIIHIIN